MRVSVVIPAFNEAGNIGALVKETYEVVPREMLAEVIVVDDCSDDATGAEVKALIGALPGLRYLRHGQRSGQSTAMRTGILAASSPVIATMDGDGQNDPRDIARLLSRLAAPGTSGPALVGGVRTRREAESSKRYASRFANWLRDKVLQDRCPDTGCGIKVYWREAFLRLPFFTSIHRYLPALFQAYGHEVAYQPVHDRPRKAGVSKYNNLHRALVGIHDLVGVSWIIKRTRVPAIAEDVAEGRQVTDFAGRLGRRGDGPKKSTADKT
jgi:dolichol-phosphate mannosyltransferase